MSSTRPRQSLSYSSLVPSQALRGPSMLARACGQLRAVECRGDRSQESSGLGAGPMAGAGGAWEAAEVTLQKTWLLERFT